MPPTCEHHVMKGWVGGVEMSMMVGGDVVIEWDVGGYDMCVNGVE